MEIIYNIMGIYVIFIVKNAHKDFPHALLQEKNIEIGQWRTCAAEMNGIHM